MVTPLALSAAILEHAHGYVGFNCRACGKSAEDFRAAATATGCKKIWQRRAFAQGSSASGFSRFNSPMKSKSRCPAMRVVSGISPGCKMCYSLASSLTLHIAIITAGVLFFNFAPRFINPNKEQVIIPESKSIEKNAMPGGIEHPGLNNDPTRAAAQDLTKQTDDQGLSTKLTNNLAQAAWTRQRRKRLCRCRQKRWFPG